MRPTFDSIRKTSLEVSKALKEDMKAAFEVDLFKRKGKQTLENTFGFVPFSNVDEVVFEENFSAGWVLYERFHSNLKKIETNNYDIYQNAKAAETSLKDSINHANSVFHELSTFNNEILSLANMIQSISKLQENVVNICDKIIQLEVHLNHIEIHNGNENIRIMQEYFDQQVIDYRIFKLKEYEDFENSHESKKLLEKLKDQETKQDSILKDQETKQDNTTKEETIQSSENKSPEVNDDPNLDNILEEITK